MIVRLVDYKVKIYKTKCKKFLAVILGRLLNLNEYAQMRSK